MTLAFASVMAPLKNLLEFLKFSHTLFALPFALISMMVAARGWPQWSIFGWILLCLVSARTAAMSFNRLIDWNLDQDNPRTESRHRLIHKNVGWLLLIVSMGLFVFSTFQLNQLCVLLSPLAMVMITFYSITKRFTAYSHLYLGLALAVAPMGAWAAVRGELWTGLPYVLALGVLLWVAGFDIIYATMDIDFDRSKGLHSLPARLGLARALTLARSLHIVAALIFLLFGYLADLGFYYVIAWFLSCLALVWEHRLSRTGQPQQLNQAFFHVNAVVGAVLFLGVSLDLYLQ
jgi:4-hydroxybenzoate polyprenyltransferase